MYIDTHCHLDFDEYKDDRAEVINRARQANVKYLINIGTTVESSKSSVELTGQYDFIYASCGIHPHYSGEVDEEILNNLKELASGKKVVAIGEVGLDFFKSFVPEEKQKEAFVKFINLAGQLDLPLIIHNRDAHPQIVKILRNNFSPPVKGVLHCFSGDLSFAQTILKMGLYVSFTANITFKNAHSLREIIKSIPLEKMLIETDAPFLAPQIFRGKRNEPSYVKYVARTIAEVKGLDVEKVADVTTQNAVNLFFSFSL